MAQLVEHYDKPSNGLGWNSLHLHLVTFFLLNTLSTHYKIDVSSASKKYTINSLYKIDLKSASKKENIAKEHVAYNGYKSLNSTLVLGLEYSRI